MLDKEKEVQMILLDNYVSKYMSTAKANFHYAYASHISDDRWSISDHDYTCSYTADTWFSNISGKLTRYLYCVV